MDTGLGASTPPKGMKIKVINNNNLKNNGKNLIKSRKILFGISLK